MLNLGIEGIMVAGAFTGWLTVYQGGRLWTGVAVAAATGALLGLLRGWLTVTLALSQHVTGLGITLFGRQPRQLRLPGELSQSGQPADHHAVCRHGLAAGYPGARTRRRR